MVGRNKTKKEVKENKPHVGQKGTAAFVPREHPEKD